jgi:hypothetical protein
MHFSVDETLTAELSQRARERGMSVSRYLAELVESSRPRRWPDGYLDSVLGSCREEPLEAPDDLPPDDEARF